jgi:hypothetical protein
METVRDLINQLKKYDLDTPISGGYIDNKSMNHLDLVIKESHPLGSREFENDLLLWIGCINK